MIGQNIGQRHMHAGDWSTDSHMFLLTPKYESGLRPYSDTIVQKKL